MQARFQALLEFRAALERSVPGVLLIILGAFYTVDRARQHESDGWYGLLFIPVGWLLVRLLARKSWRRYKARQKNADKTEYDYSLGPPADFDQNRC